MIAQLLLVCCIGSSQPGLSDDPPTRCEPDAEVLLPSQHDIAEIKEDFTVLISRYSAPEQESNFFFCRFAFICTARTLSSKDMLK